MGLDEAAGTGAAEESDIPTPAGPRTDQSRAESPNPLPAEPMLEPRPQATSKTQKKPRRASYLWAMLIARVYKSLPLLCRCGQPMKIVAFITETDTIEKILEHIGEPTEPPIISPARDPPQADFDFHDPEPTWV